MNRPMNSCKVFLGGLSWDTTDEKLRAYFENFGIVKEAFVSYCRETGRPRGFGFVVFESPQVCDRVVQHKHTIDRREVDAKYAMPRAEALGLRPPGSWAAEQLLTRNARKLFIGGLPANVTDVMLRQHFEQVGPVEDAVVMMDHQSRRSRGFGFVSFVDEGTAELVLRLNPRPILFGRQVEIKRAVPREQLQQDPYALQRRFNTAMLPGAAGPYAAAPSPYAMGYAGTPTPEAAPAPGVYMPPERQARQLPMSAFGYSAEWSQLLERHGQRASTAPQMLAELQGWHSAHPSPPMHMAGVAALSAPMVARQASTPGDSGAHGVDATYAAGARSATHSGTATNTPSVLQPGMPPYTAGSGAALSPYYTQVGAHALAEGVRGSSTAGAAGQSDAFDNLAASLSAALPGSGHEASTSQSGQWN